MNLLAILWGVIGGGLAAAVVYAIVLLPEHGDIGTLNMCGLLTVSIWGGFITGCFISYHVGKGGMVTFLIPVIAVWMFSIVYIIIWPPGSEVSLSWVLYLLLAGGAGGVMGSFCLYIARGWSKTSEMERERASSERG
jgi:hypothetical protein